MKSISNRVDGMHKAETERVNRAWDRYHDLVFAELTDAELGAFVEAGELSDAEATEVINPQTDLLAMFEPVEAWNDWIAAANSKLPEETIVPHTGGPECFPTPPREPPGAMNRLHRAFDEAGSERRRMAVASLLVAVSMARATRHFQLEAK